MCTNKKVALNWYYIKLKGKCDILEVRFDLKKNVTEKEKQEFNSKNCLQSKATTQDIQYRLPLN